MILVGEFSFRFLVVLRMTSVLLSDICFTGMKIWRKYWSFQAHSVFALWTSYLLG